MYYYNCLCWKKYTFTEENIRELEEVAVLRKAGFSILEISLMKEMPEKLPEILEKKKLSIEILKRQKKGCVTI